MKVHGSYNLEKVLKFSGRLSKSLNLVKVLEKYLIPLLLCLCHTIFCEIRLFCQGNFGSSPVQKPVKLTGTVKTFLGMKKILFLFLYISSDC